MNIDKSFKILGLSDNASLEELKRVYRDLVRIYHPDQFVNDDVQKQKAENKLKEINVAYEKLRLFLSSNKKTVSFDKTKDKSKSLFDIIIDIFKNLWSSLAVNNDRNKTIHKASDAKFNEKGKKQTVSQKIKSTNTKNANKGFTSKEKDKVKNIQKSFKRPNWYRIKNEKDNSPVEPIGRIVKVRRIDGI